MKNIGKALIITVSFFTTIPMPYIEWNPKYNKYMPLFIPFIGIIIGGLFYLLYYGLSFIEVSVFLKAVVLTSFFVLITGGLHMDAYMDTCDAHFSRRPMEQKLVIMKDSNIGAFAALFLVVLLLIKVALMYEIVLNDTNVLLLVNIPFISRFMQSIMLLNTKFAKDDGLAKMYGSLSKRYQYWFLFYAVVFILLVIYVLPLMPTLIVLGISVLHYFYHRHFAIKSFGGITGDVVGAYIEITEVLMLMGVVIYGLI